MRILMILVVGLMVVGCGKQEQADTNESTPTTTEKPVKELTLEDKDVIGTYELIITLPKLAGKDTAKLILLENGMLEIYGNGKKIGEAKWKMSKEGELHTIYEDGDIGVCRINTKDNLGISHVSSFTQIATIENGKRRDLPKAYQAPYKKIK